MPKANKTRVFTRIKTTGYQTKQTREDRRSARRNQKKITKKRYTSNEKTVSNGKSFSSSDSMHKIDPSEK